MEAAPDGPEAGCGNPPRGRDDGNGRPRASLLLRGTGLGPGCGDAEARGPMSALRGRRVVNAEVPAQVPMRRMGEIPVLARVAWDDGAQEWLQAMAVRWTSTLVMVMWRDKDGPSRTERFEWLRAHDVVRIITWLPDVEVPARSGSIGSPS